MINIYIEIQMFTSDGEVNKTKGTTITLNEYQSSTNYRDIEKYIMSNINDINSYPETKINVTFRHTEFLYRTSLRINPLAQVLAVDDKFYNDRLGYCVRDRHKPIKRTIVPSFKREISDIIVSDYEVICASVIS